MKWTAWTTLAALSVYLWTIFNVGRARAKYRVMAPAVDGPPAFLSVMRVQANTVEQMVMFLPALWLCAVFLDERWAALGGVTWCVGRIVYALAYYRDPSRRGLGFGITMLATAGLMAGAAFGLLAGATGG